MQSLSRPKRGCRVLAMEKDSRAAILSRKADGSPRGLISEHGKERGKTGSVWEVVK